MRRFRHALVPTALALAITAEWSSYNAGELELAVADGVVGIVLVVCGVVAWERRESSHTGPLMILAGFAWFAGTLSPIALFWHRGPLVHLHISYPTGRLRRRLAIATVVLAYVDASVGPLAHNDVVTVILAVLVALASIDVLARTSGAARRAGVPALVAALTYASVLAAPALQRLAGWDADRAMGGGDGRSPGGLARPTQRSWKTARRTRSCARRSVAAGRLLDRRTGLLRRRSRPANRRSWPRRQSHGDRHRPRRGTDCRPRARCDHRQRFETHRFGRGRRPPGRCECPHAGRGSSALVRARRVAATHRRIR